MSKIIINHLLHNKTTHLVLASLMACCLWWHYYSTRIVEKSYTVPCCFYNGDENRVEEAPDKLTIFLRATRRALSMIDEKSLALHLDISSLKPGKHKLVIQENNLFLPENIKLVNWKPIHSYIYLH